MRWRNSARSSLSKLSFLGSTPFLVVALAVGVISVILGLLFTIPSPYQVLMPGPVYDVHRLIQPAPKNVKGQLLLTTIYSDPASIGEWIYAELHPHAGIIPREQARPPNLGEREYQRILVSLMDESKITAQVVALREAGYDVKITGQGVLVQEIAEYSRARGVLQQGDIIVQADGRPVPTANDLVVVIQSHRPGDTVTLRVKRGEEELELRVLLVEAPDEPGRARAGIVVVTHLYQYDLPVQLKIETRVRGQDIGGPSAGLMFALGVYNAVTERDITGGRKIAGSGSIATDGRVGAVGGVKYKVLAAERAGADIFLVPVENEAEARGAATRIRVVPVGDFKSALAALAS